MSQHEKQSETINPNVLGNGLNFDLILHLCKSIVDLDEYNIKSSKQFSDYIENEYKQWKIECLK